MHVRQIVDVEGTQVAGGGRLDLNATASFQ
jgi:hypothetical protein